MKCYYLPLDDACIVYRPLLPLAFVASNGMASLIERCANGETVSGHDDARGWLDSIGFWEPDRQPQTLQAPKPASPHTAVLLMTTDCNLRCTYCYANAGSTSANNMPASVGRRLIEQAALNALRDGADEFAVVFHGGGEPTTHWQTLTELVDYASSLSPNARMSMATNGVISRRRLDFIVDHFDELSISIDGLGDVQNSQRPTAGGNESFEAVMKTLARLDAAGFRYGLRMTVTPPNFHTIPAAVRFLIDNTTATGIQVEPAYAAPRGSHGSGTGAEGADFAQHFTEALEIGIEKNRFVYYSGATPWRITDSFCRAASDALVGTPDGDLVGCFEIHDGKHALIDRYRLGLVDPDPDVPVLHDPGLNNVFQAEETTRKAACEGCFCYYHCAGDCSVLRPDGSTTTSARCDTNRTVTKEILLRMIADAGGVWRGS